MENLGFRVHIKFAECGMFSGEQINRNVTEIHYNYRNGMAGRLGRELRVAFESDIHGTGVNCNMADILEFEAIAEEEKADSFSAGQ